MRCMKVSVLIMGEFDQVHEIKKSLCRLRPYAKVTANQERRNRGEEHCRQWEQHAQRVCLRNQRMKREATVEEEGKPDKNDETGSQCHPWVPPSLGIT